jgi:ubiquinol-cytochrome c reductase cytochrome c subunit
MSPRFRYLIPALIALAVTSLALVLTLQIVWRPWSSANTSARTDLNLRPVIPPDYNRTPLAWVGLSPAAASTSQTATSTAALNGSIPAAGRALYFAKGCAACHGADAQGGAVGPSVTGAEAGAILKQVRTPRGRMPAFPPAALSDHELDQIAVYLSSLPKTAIAAGHALYFAKGCAACHGADARGSAVGPPVAGIEASTVVEQVHAPRAQMPTFSKGALSRHELEQIATYLSSLPRLARSQGGR